MRGTLRFVSNEDTVFFLEFDLTMLSAGADETESMLTPAHQSR
jgi:hypothetical protein